MAISSSRPTPKTSASSPVMLPLHSSTRPDSTLESSERWVPALVNLPPPAASD